MKCEKVLDRKTQRLAMKLFKPRMAALQWEYIQELMPLVLEVLYDVKFKLLDWKLVVDLMALDEECRDAERSASETNAENKTAVKKNP